MSVSVSVSVKEFWILFVMCGKATYFYVTEFTKSPLWTISIHGRDWKGGFNINIGYQQKNSYNKVEYFTVYFRLTSSS